MKSLERFEYLSPETLDQAFALYQANAEALFLAGGTDFMPLLKRGLKNPEQIISLRRIPYLKQIETRPAGLFIGAMHTLSGLGRDPRIRDHFPTLSRAASYVASPQIRNQATLAGNILQDRRCLYFNQPADWRKSLAPCFKTMGRLCHQVPKSPGCRAVYHSDLAPVLLALDAKVECFDQGGFSQKPLAQLIHDHVDCNGRAQKINYLVTGLVVPFLPQNAWMRFVKQSVRASLDFALLNAALLYLPPDANSPSGQVRLVAGAIAPEPIVLTETAQFIRDRGLAPAHKEEVIAKALAELNAKCALIRETGISVPARKKAFGALGRLIEEWFEHSKG